MPIMERLPPVGNSGKGEVCKTFMRRVIRPAPQQKTHSKALRVFYLIIPENFIILFI